MAIMQLDDARPFVSVNGQPVKWGSGSAALRMLSSRQTRIHARGVFFKPRMMRSRDLEKVGWGRQRCVQSPVGLCETDTSFMFLSWQTPVVSERLDWLCPSSNTGRMVTNTSRYDASACDVVDARMDYVYADGVLFSAATALPDWVYWTVCLLVVYLVRCLSRYVLASLGRADQADAQQTTNIKTNIKPSINPNIKPSINPSIKPNIKPSIKPNITTNTKTQIKTNENTDQKQPSVHAEACLVVCAACTFLVLIHGDWVFTTQEDLIFYWFTVFYIGSYASLLLGTRLAARLQLSSGPDPPFYNLLAGVLQLVAMRLYAGAETPYSPPLIFIVAVRALVKSRRRVDILRAITLMLDACMLGLMIAFGFSYPRPYLTAVLTAAAAGADLLV